MWRHRYLRSSHRYRQVRNYNRRATRNYRLHLGNVIVYRQPVYWELRSYRLPPQSNLTNLSSRNASRPPQSLYLQLFVFARVLHFLYNQTGRSHRHSCGLSAIQPYTKAIPSLPKLYGIQFADFLFLHEVPQAPFGILSFPSTLVSAILRNRVNM